VLADLTRVGQKVLLAEGGNGGFGNLQLIADVGLLGLPNAGKSTFLAATSNARPKIADYPFTTLHPNLGVVGVDNTEMVIADIPGLIEGAHEGVGLGTRFLGHVERCAVLLHLVDGTAQDVVEDYKTIISELKQYGEGLNDKPRVTVLNKIDALDEELREMVLRELEEASGGPVLMMSGVSREGVEGVLRQLRVIIDEERAPKEDEGVPWQP